MRIFHVDRRLSRSDYGWTRGAIVIALNETAARHLVDGLSMSKQFNDPTDLWLSPEHSTARELGVAHGTEEEIVLTDEEEG